MPDLGTRKTDKCGMVTSFVTEPDFSLLADRTPHTKLSRRVRFPFFCWLSITINISLVHTHVACICTMTDLKHRANFAGSLTLLLDICATFSHVGRLLELVCGCGNYACRSCWSCISCQPSREVFRCYLNQSSLHLSEESVVFHWRVTFFLQTQVVDDEAIHQHHVQQAEKERLVVLFESTNMDMSEKSTVTTSNAHTCG